MYFLRKHSARTFALSLMTGVASFALASTLPAAAQTAGRSVALSIPAQPVPRALAALSSRTGVQVLYAGSKAYDLTSNPVSGHYTVDQALRTLLSGTGITYRFVNANSVTISVPGEQSPQVEAGLDTGDAIQLEAIDITTRVDAAHGAGFMGTPDWVYETPASVSVITREAIKTVPVRDTRDLFANVAGVYAGEGNGSFPTVSPNIRGLQDAGRIVVSIDGARQNAQRGPGFGAGFGSYGSNSGQAVVDSAFVREIDVAKTTDAKAGSAGSLGGKVDFRTVGADDLIAEGNSWGMETNLTLGTNEYNAQGSALAATRIGEYFSLTGGLSGLNVGEYKPGTDGDAFSLNNSLGRESWSSFLKLEFDNHEDITASLSWMHQDKKFDYGTGSGGFANHEHVRNDNLVARINWDPASDLIDFQARLWLNNSANDEKRDTRRLTPTSSAPPETDLDIDNRSFGGSLENTSRLDTGLGELTLNYGAEAFRDKATFSAASETIAVNPLYETGYILFGPPGQRDVASGFFNGTLEPTDWVRISGGLRYDWYRLKGTPTYYDRRDVTVGTPSRLAEAITTYGSYLQVYSATLYDFWLARCNNASLPPAQQTAACNRLLSPGEIVGTSWYYEGQTIQGTQQTIQTYPEHEIEVDRTDSAWLPSVTVDFTPVDWFRPYASYSQSFRPPTITEAFITGSPPGDWVGYDFAPNPSLRAESGETWEIGANISRDGLFREDDTFRLKTAAFYREIDDYIVLGKIYTAEVSDRTYSSFVNMDGTTRMKGLEVEANYDARRFYIGAAATWLDTKWPDKTVLFTNGTDWTNGEVTGVAGNVPPKFKLTVDAGLRFFDERLTLGGRYTRTSPTLTRTISLGDLEVTEATETYSVYDLYGSYAFSANATLRVAVNNLTDLRYVPAGGLFLAPGRTATVGLNLKF